MAELRLALFASGRVGAEVAAALADAGVAPVCLVVDGGPAAAAELLDRFEPQMLPELFDHEQVAGAEGPDRLRALDLDLGILAWWPFILRPEVLQTTRLGFLNLHPSLLPHGRGKDPNFWALVDGTPFGVTLHFVDEGVDTGPIAFQRELSISWEDTGATLYERARTAIVELFRENLPRILAGDIPAWPQDADRATFHRRRDLEPRSQIDLDATYTARELLNLLRARTFEPFPAVRFTEGGEAYEVRVSIRRLRDA